MVITVRRFAATPGVNLHCAIRKNGVWAWWEQNGQTNQPEFLTWGQVALTGLLHVVLVELRNAATPKASLR